MVQAAAINATARKTDLLITQLHATAATAGSTDRLGYGIPIFPRKIYREF
jgi:hypothetical protein